MSTGNEGTDVFYNGVWLRNCLTRQFDQTVEYDESGTDRLFTRFHITVENLVSENITEWGECHGALLNRTDLNHADAQTKMSALHGLLSVPRQYFEYRQGGVALIKADSNVAIDSVAGAVFQTTTDLNNGPKPKVVSIQHVIANKCYRVTFAIEICLLLCGELNDTTTFANVNWASLGLTGPKASAAINRKLLSNRFSIEEVRDGSFYNTRTVIGRARVAHPALWDLTIRYLLLPMLPFGYKRESLQFTHNSDGLDVAYRIVDRQRYAAPPWPAIDFHGTHTEATGMDGVISQGSVSVRMLGQPGTAKKYLLMAAIAVVESRIGKLGRLGEADTKVITDHIQITDVLHENVVEIAIAFRRFGEEEAQSSRFANVMYQRLGLLPSVFALQGNATVRSDGRPANSDLWTFAPDPWGYEGHPPYGVFAQFLQDGCWPVHMTPDTSGYTGPPLESRYPQLDEESGSRGGSYQNGGDDLGSEPPPPDQSYSDRASEDHKALPYTDVEVKIDYFNDYGLVALPFIKSGSSDEPENDDVLITRLHAPTCRKNIFLTAKRVGAQPKIPKLDYDYTDANGIRYRLDEFHPEFTAPRLMANGLDFEYQINARLVYLMSRALKQDDELSFGSLPWDNTTKTENKVSLNTDQQDEEMA
jgi:hypothetical protein